MTDNRLNYTVPSGTGENMVMECEGFGVFDNGQQADVRLTLTVDADDQMFVRWKPRY